MTEIFFKIRNAASRENRPGRLVDVSIDVHCGECLTLSGHTFSGIKELYAILTKNGEYKGNILLQNGRELRECRSGYEAGALYIDQRVICAVHEESLLHSLSVISGQSRIFSIVDDGRTAARFAALLEKLDYHDCHLNLKDSLSSLTRFERVQFAILRCLYASAGCILLENPFQGLRGEEIGQLVQLLAKAKAYGTALVYMSDENVRYMEKLIDRVAVLRRGTVGYVFYPEGADHRFDYGKIELAAGGKVKEQKGLVMPLKADNRVVLTVQKNGKAYHFSSGERVGIYDPEMKIPSEYAPLAAYLKDCEVTLNGQCIRLRGTNDFLRHSIVLIRKDPGQELFRNLSPVENVTLLSGRRVNAVFSRRRIERYIYREVCEHYSYLRSCLAIMDKTNCYGVGELDLKGLVVAKWLSLDPKIVLFFDLEDTYQPGEQQQSNELIRQLSQEGVLAITVSPNLDFLEKTCDRIIN